MRIISTPSTSASAARSSASPLPSDAFRSIPHWLVSSAIRHSSRAPVCASALASSTTGSHGLERNLPRNPGMAQNVHLWSQPSATRRYA